MRYKTLNDWLEYISQTHPSEIEMGLERIRSVYTSLNLLLGNTKVVLVAGTNGKGSTIAMMEACLLSLGYRVGAYTSPHILKFNERVRINGKDVSDSLLINAFDSIENVRQKTPLTYFEYGTLAAFQILFEQNLDVVLLEIGLGGRLDAVNIIDPDISIITSVDLDHTEWLGDTVEKIGVEKAGILRENTIFLAGEDLPESVFRICRELGCRNLTCRKDFAVNVTTSPNSAQLNLKGKPVIFKGFPNKELPQNNILLALQALVILLEQTRPQDIFDQNVYSNLMRVINNLTLPGRLEKVSLRQDLPIYLDVGHNPHAARYLKVYLQEKLAQGFNIQLVYSALADKDSRAVLQELATLACSCVLTQLDTPRALRLTDLVRSAESLSANNIKSFEMPSDAFTYAMSFAEQSKEEGKPVFTLIFGSFYMVEAAKRFFSDYD